MFGGERKFSDETSSDSDSLHFTAISSDSNPEMNEQSGRNMFLGAFMRNTSEKSVFEDFEDEDFILIRPPSPSDVSIQAESCGFISKEDLSAANSRSSLPNANHVPTSSNVSSLFIESSSKPIRLEPAYDNSNESSCWPVNQSSPKSQARGANFGGLQLRSRVKVFSEAMVKTYLINPASGDLTSSEFPDKLCSAQETFDHSSKTDAIITRDEAGGLDDEVSLPETDEDESCNLFRKSEDASKINPEELVDAVDVNNATSPFVGKQTSFDEDAGGETDQRKEIEKQENERPFGDSGETNEIDGLVGTQIVDGGNDNEAQHSFQEIANEERVEGNHDDGIVEHGSTYSLPFAAASRISCGPLGDIITKSAESLPNLINFVENVLSITENECHKSLLQSILSLTFLIKSRINDHQKSPEIVANLEELSAHLKGQLGMP